MQGYFGKHSMYLETTPDKSQQGVQFVSPSTGTGSAASRTKIVATIGPASRSPEMLRKLIDAGVSVFRLNFSHGTHEEHSAVLADIRKLSKEMGRHVAVLQDLCGPKMRLGAVPGDLIDCRLGDEFALVAESASANAGD